MKRQTEPLDVLRVAPSFLVLLTVDYFVFKHASDDFIFKLRFDNLYHVMLDQVLVLQRLYGLG